MMGIAMKSTPHRMITALVRVRVRVRVRHRMITALVRVRVRVRVRHRMITALSKARLNRASRQTDRQKSGQPGTQARSASATSSIAAWDPVC